MSGETLAVPRNIRAQVDERDGGHCRFCGAYLGDRRVIHHIHYGGDIVGLGGRRQHSLENLISLCDAFDNRCHQKVHAQKSTWQPILAQLARIGDVAKGVTALQVKRWNDMRSQREH